jgi:hypothetical protein
MNRTAWAFIGAVSVLGVTTPAGAFIDSPKHPADNYSLSWARDNAWIAVLKVDRVDAESGIVVYELAEQLQGKEWPKRVKHLVKLDGKVPPGLDKIEVGQTAVCFAWDRQFKLFVTYVQGSWYLSTPDRDDLSTCRIFSQRPDLNCLFVGPAADLADAFRELAADRDVIVRCQKGKKESATLFVRCRPEKQKKRESVPALDAVAENLPADPASDPKKAVPALVSALRSDDALIRTTAAKLLKEIDPEAAKKAAER